jgi:Trypsin-co-occurring domain 1
MPGERSLPVELDDGSKLVVIAEQVGPALVADNDVVAKLGSVTSSIEQVSRDILDAVRRAAPTRATVELGFGLAIETGQLVALFGKGKGETTIKVTLEWSRAEAAGSLAVDPPAIDSP